MWHKCLVNNGNVGVVGAAGTFTTPANGNSLFIDLGFTPSKLHVEIEAGHRTYWYNNDYSSSGIYSASTGSVVGTSGVAIAKANNGFTFNTPVSAAANQLAYYFAVK